jgi:HEPN domain-containing protein
MFKGGHWRYVVFLCHLAVEKSIKAMVQKKAGRLPPKVHDLVLLLRKADVALPEDLQAFIGQLSGLSIPTRYPDDLRVAARAFSRKSAGQCLQIAARVLRWFEQAVR